MWRKLLIAKQHVFNIKNLLDKQFCYVKFSFGLALGLTAGVLRTAATAAAAGFFTAAVRGAATAAGFF